MRSFLTAAITECAVAPTYVLDCLGNPENQGIQRLREISAAPFSIHVRNVVEQSDSLVLQKHAPASVPLCAG